MGVRCAIGRSLARVWLAAPAGPARRDIVLLPDTMNGAPVTFSRTGPRVSPPRARAAAAVILVGLLLVLPAATQPRAPASPKGGPAPAEPAAARITTALVEGRAVQRSVDTVGSLLAWEE